MNLLRNAGRRGGCRGVAAIGLSADSRVDRWLALECWPGRALRAARDAQGAP
jgi:hypothetical protein